MYERPPALPPRRTGLVVAAAVLFLIAICLLGAMLLVGFAASDWSTGGTSLDQSAVTDLSGGCRHAADCDRQLRIGTSNHSRINVDQRRRG